MMAHWSFETKAGVRTRPTGVARHCHCENVFTERIMKLFRFLRARYVICDRCGLFVTTNVIINRDSATLAIGNGPIGFSVANKDIMENVSYDGRVFCIRSGQCHVDAEWPAVRASRHLMNAIECNYEVRRNSCSFFSDLQDCATDRTTNWHKIALALTLALIDERVC